MLEEEERADTNDMPEPAGSENSPTRARNLVFRTLPNGCIPTSRDLWANYDFNHIDIWRRRSEISNARSFVPLNSRKDVWPIWAPDLFGITSRLHEHTGIYQLIRPRNFDPTLEIGNDDLVSALFPWTKQGEHFSPHDPFGIQNLHQVILRVIGAIWGSGALVISGQQKVVVDEKTKKARLETINDSDVIEASKVQCRVAVEFLKKRMNSEVPFDAFSNIIRLVHRHYKSWTMNDSSREGYTKELSGGERSGGQLSDCKLTLRSLIENHVVDMIKKTSNKNSELAKEEDNPNLVPAYQIDSELALVLWACDYIYFHWLVLIGSNKPVDGDSPRHASMYSDSEQRYQVDWEAAVVRLHIIADEASKGLGFGLVAGYSLAANDPKIYGHGCQQLGLSMVGIWDQFCINRQTVESPHKRPPRTLTRCFHGSFGAVLPKARTPSMGCSIRSLSHNLCLLPPKGQVRARWSKHPTVSDSSTFNILLVPYPYIIKSKHVRDSKVRPGSKADWAYFNVQPNWLYEDDSKKNGRLERPDDPSERRAYHASMWAFLKSLLDDQASDTVDCIIFPEGSLDWETFNYLQERILLYPNSIDDDNNILSNQNGTSLSMNSRIKMFVAGLSEAPQDLLNFSSVHTTKTPANGQPESRLIAGNFVATFVRHEQEPGGEKEVGSDASGVPPLGARWGLKHIRAKHHRWRLDKAQLRTYALSHRLDPTKLWWEHISLPPREMLFSEFATGSILTTLICEDLARIDPCQAAIRAVGPNLILVLLMDSAQVVERWPYQYAGVLADDPGSSVLTLTSFGLIKRASHSDGYSSRSIAIWREPNSGRPEKVELPEGYHAVLVTLRQEYGRERTLDGRGDNGDSASVWRLAGRMPIRAQVNPPGGGPDGAYPLVDLTVERQDTSGPAQLAKAPAHFGQANRVDFAEGEPS